MVARQDEAAADRIGSSIAGKYRLIRVLGAGAMGAVYEATDGQGQHLAVKLLHDELSGHEEVRARFLREGKICQHIDHPNVVPVYDSGMDGAAPFLVMPILHGYDMAGLLERNGPLNAMTAVRLLLQACEGLGAAHRAGIVHRDLKPSNLFLSFDAGRITVKVADFGMAKRLDMYDDTHLTKTGASLGSPLYMAPEQLTTSKDVDERADVWAMGVTMFELLCGATPHGDAKTLSDLLVRICTTNVRSIQDWAPWVSPELATVIHSALARPLDVRCSSIGELAERLTPFANGETSVSESDIEPISASMRAHCADRANLSPYMTAEGPAFGVAGAESSTVDPMIGAQLAGKYRVVRLLGRGGMGSVYEAETPEGVRVAVKVISPGVAGDDRHLLARFVREARAAQAINHPNVVRTLDVGTDDKFGVPFIVMELLRGVDLSTLYKRHGAMEPDGLARVFWQAAQGISAAHAKNIVHRDIKPGNIFLQVTPGSGQVTAKVCDFGIAKEVGDGVGDATQSDDLTKTGGVLGSPMYMSPEQATDAKSVDMRTDIWSLAVSLYEGLAGRPPWAQTNTLGEIIIAVCTTDAPFLQNVAPWVAPDLADVVHRGLQRNRDARYATMTQLIEELGHITGGEGLVNRDQLQGLDAAERSSQAVRSRLATVHQSGATRSRRPVVGALAAAGVGAAVAIGVGYWLLKEPAPAVDVASEESIATAPPEESPPQLAAPLTARVSVRPTDVAAVVDDQPVLVVKGVIELTGQPGDDFEIALKKGSDSETFHVVMRRDGTVAPDQIALKPAQTPAPKQVVRGRVARPRVTPVPAPRPVTPVPAAPEPPAPKQQPVVEAQTKGRVAPVDEF